MISFTAVTFAMLIPSTLLTVLLIIIVLKKSPSSMNKYKYIVIFVSISIYQFDFLDSVFLCPAIVRNVAGLQFRGILGFFFPKEGNLCLLVFVVSIIIAGFSLTFSFVWREYSLLQFELKPCNIIFNALHGLIVLTVFVFFFPMMNRMFVDQHFYYDTIISAGTPFDPNFAVFAGVAQNMNQFAEFGGYASLTAILVGTYILKAVIRITLEIRKPKQYLSPNTIRIHKMLLKSLIYQIVAPIILFVIPINLLVLSAFNHKPEEWFGVEAVNTFNQQLAAVVITIPSFFTTVHVCTVIYFTTPYRQYVAKLLSWKKTPVTTTVTHSDYDPRKGRRHTEMLSRGDVTLVVGGRKGNSFS